MAHTNRSHLIDSSARPAQIKTGVSGLGNNKLTQHHQSRLMVSERFSHFPQRHLHQCQQLRPDLR
ncbi:hypothetical protein F444_23011 [Phytophthora nicotianae P1976]|uniref:Uncharacterized protein n=1 Tax=Phytophthora nicotianae P1976 TaxID=1317066 RepID=A0A080YW50_PHYNI|nr:hypothetical protein F444_23011 [Phytophthora nicotianae P1976]